ncbi:2-C-methyl-D-erythritol 4-phosphate cytidylyltransferase [Williamsia deligens]|uniref:2-C-methyl-D-erythritol 4-phosphate cytidylyltransferase n=1 Tax=Williamsia deligens TaxID=321325 RepID=A0ABW3G5F3_9NOCA|nr:2-C-methyl-D-erythritol 4-phosphate cytidylyltransferase [Williamsia deligens]MCP2194396.1 2-C-methyl-D-erythritol 4-phosphate cytidylyltransferase [Williamsia deligens]
MPTTASTVALIPAAGSGTRLGAGIPKAFVDLCGRTILQRSVDGVLAAGVDRVVVAVPANLVAETRAQVPDAQVVVGGAARSDSVRACLAATGDHAEPPDVVLIHDAARALTPPDVFSRVVGAVLSGHDVVIPAVAVTDTLKRVGDDGAVLATVDRTPLRAVQTPQGFRPDALRRAHASNGDATDDAGLAEADGMRVHVVDGDLMAFKITTDWDLRMARMLIEHGATANPS